MKFFSEIIVLYDHIDMPSEDQFCPFFWQAESFDADGDFYWDGMMKSWTNLKLSKRSPAGQVSEFELNIYRENSRKFDPTIVEVADLARYIIYKSEGRYERVEQIKNASNLCVASFIITTNSSADYEEYMKTIHFFLSYTNGIAANLLNFDADTFRIEMLD